MSNQKEENFDEIVSLNEDLGSQREVNKEEFGNLMRAQQANATSNNNTKETED